MSLLHHRVLNGWPLFSLISLLTFAAIVLGLLVTSVSTPEATVGMIRLSVQLASPWVFLAFVTTPVKRLFPGALSKWMVRNRRYFGLLFAAGFAWQAVFIIVLLAKHDPYYWEQLHNTVDLTLRLASYMLLLALTVTSFYPVRKKMRRDHWRTLHLVGIWYFWAAIWVSYASMAFIENARVISIVYFFLGLAALVLRVVAHVKSRSVAEADLHKQREGTVSPT